MQYKANKQGRFGHWLHDRATGKPRVVFEVAFEDGDTFEVPDIYPSKVLIEKGYANAAQ